MFAFKLPKSDTKKMLFFELCVYFNNKSILHYPKIKLKILII